MGGDIAVIRRKAGGTTFTLMVTLALAEAAKASNAGADQDTPSEAAPALRLLSVEDNPFGRVVLNAILTELGHQAEFIGQGTAAAERVAQGAFDAVLMEWCCPTSAASRRSGASARCKAQSGASRSSASPAAATTRPPRAPPAPTPFWSSLCLRGL